MQNKLDTAVVILFNPDISVVDNITTYIDCIKVLYIVDNSYQKQVLSQKKLENLFFGVNHSLSQRHNKNLKFKIYPPVRLYYMARNYLYLKKNYYQEDIEFFKQRDRYLLRFFLNQILHGNNLFKNLMIIFRDILDFKDAKYGKYNEQA